MPTARERRALVAWCVPVVASMIVGLAAGLTSERPWWVLLPLAASTRPLWRRSSHAFSGRPFAWWQLPPWLVARPLDAAFLLLVAVLAGGGSGSITAGVAFGVTAALAALGPHLWRAWAPPPTP